jgi:hypothetical protein
MIAGGCPHAGLLSAALPVKNINFHRGTMTKPLHVQVLQSILTDPNSTPEQKMIAADKLEKARRKRRNFKADRSDRVGLPKESVSIHPEPQYTDGHQPFYLCPDHEGTSFPGCVRCRLHADMIDYVERKEAANG